MNDPAQSQQAVVVDTCVVSIIFKGATEQTAYQDHLAGKLLVLSPMTVAELDRWALERQWGAARRYELEREMRRYVIESFSRTLCLKWAEATYSAGRNGLTLSCSDAWVAAVALLHQIPLVTNNQKDFRGVTDLQVISESAGLQGLEVTA